MTQKNCVSVFTWPQNVAEMKHDVKRLFIFFLFNCCKQYSHMNICILKVCFSSEVYTLHMVDYGARIGFAEWMKRKRHPSEDVCNVVESDVKKKVSVKTSLASIYSTKLKSPGVICAQNKHLDWSWFNVVATFYNPLKTGLRQLSQENASLQNVYETFR